jgi:hypothetical protein
MTPAHIPISGGRGRCIVPSLAYDVTAEDPWSGEYVGAARLRIKTVYIDENIQCTKNRSCAILGL